MTGKGRAQDSLNRHLAGVLKGLQVRLKGQGIVQGLDVDGQDFSLLMRCSSASASTGRTSIPDASDTHTVPRFSSGAVGAVSGRLSGHRRSQAQKVLSNRSLMSSTSFAGGRTGCRRIGRTKREWREWRVLRGQATDLAKQSYRRRRARATICSEESSRERWNASKHPKSSGAGDRVVFISSRPLACTPAGSFVLLSTTKAQVRLNFRLPRAG